MILVLSELFGYERLLLGGPQFRGVISGAVRWYKRVVCLFQVVLHGNGDPEVSVPASSDV